MYITCMSNFPLRQVNRTLQPAPPLDEFTPEAEQRLLAFVEEQLDRMQKAASLNGIDGQPGFYELNQALMDYQKVYLGLVSLNTLAKTELSKAQEAFDDWFANKYIEIRNEINPRNLSANKWYSTKEIEMEVRVRHPQEFKRLHDEVTYADHRVNMIRRLLEGWNSQQFVLSRLSRNVEAEYTSTHMNEE